MTSDTTFTKWRNLQVFLFWSAFTIPKCVSHSSRMAKEQAHADWFTQDKAAEVNNEYVCVATTDRAFHRDRTLSVVSKTSRSLVRVTGQLYWESSSISMTRPVILTFSNIIPRYT
jgi:hypothetical protein